MSGKADEQSAAPRKKMTFRDALVVLINAGARDIRGQGLGYRSTSEEQRQQVARAIEVVWPKAYNFPLGDAERHNLGI